ncbi:hypothetical protein HD806DRAFT_505789 [Xylariaceae sp. AK1471]|nr:hypothetical protein HD806DRAFT_505789 [Xylariaceae sp. AK1471]
MDSSGPPDNGPVDEAIDLKAQDIYSQAQECKSLFISYLDASRAPRAYHKQLRESERRFLTWASFLGVFANEGASLDSRLQYTPEIKELVVSMLQVLRRNLEHSIIRHAFSSTTSVATGPTENDGAMYGITGAINRLHRLAMAIRQSPRTDEVERVRNFASKQPPNGFYNIILVMIQYLFPDVEKTLRVQLAESIIYRRHRLLWNRRHSKKLGRQRREKEEDQPSKKKQDEPVTQPKFSQSLRASPQQRSSSRVKAKSILSSTQFTRRPLGQVMNRTLLRVQDVSQQEDTRTGRSSNPPPTAQYPDRPPVTAGETKAMCQYCLTEIEIPLAASDKMKETLWRNHFDTDLRPYVCVSEECGGFPISFSNIKEWKAHMHNNHRADWTQYIHRVMWRCPYCSGDAEPFLTKDLLVRHLTEKQAEDHAAAVDKLELARIIAKSKFARPRSANQCPLCGSPPWNNPGRMSKEPSTSSGLSGDVQEHFVTHLHHLALLSLSWWDNDIGLAVDTLDSGADSADVIGFNSDKSCNQKKENDTGGLYSWLDLDSAAMARISEIRAELELQGQINQDTLIQSLEPFQEQLRLGFSNTWRHLEELRAGLRREDQTQQDELIIQLEQLYEQLRLGAESIVPQENRSQLIIGQTIEPPYNPDQLAVSKGWHGVRYWKLAVILQDAHQKRELKQKGQSQKSSGFDSENSDASLFSVRSLADAIRDNTVESCFDGRSVAFLPEGRIHELISPEAIAEELPTLDSESLDDLDLLDFILGDAKKIFGICVFLEIEGPDLHRIMQLFHRSRFNDRTLPAPAMISGPPEGIPAPFNERLWSISMRHSFFKTQWIFLTPIFLSTGLMGHYHLNPDCILPVTWQSSTSTRRWFGQVFEAKVHPNHLESILPVIGGRLTQVPNDHPRVAIQYLHKTSPSVKVESILEHLHTEVYTRLSHKHIVRILATFALGSEYYILLEWGDKGNLRNLWAESPKTPELNPSLVKETLVQLRGLAAALYQLHEANYRHGHLKPENILRFQESNTGMCRWKIADMGVAAFTHMLDTTSGPRTGREGEEGRYGSPEAVSDPDGARSRTGDIWSMGCIIIEHMIWLLYGNDELSRFNDEILRFFYHGEGLLKKLKTERNTAIRKRDREEKDTEPDQDFIDEKNMKIEFLDLKIHNAEIELAAEPIVHPWLMAWIDHISNDQECAQATAMRDLLDIVCTRLLVVSIPPKSDDIPVGISRATAEIFRNSMDEILSKAIDERYIYTGKTRENIQGLKRRGLTKIGLY